MLDAKTYSASVPTDLVNTYKDFLIVRTRAHIDFSLDLWEARNSQDSYFGIFRTHVSNLVLSNSIVSLFFNHHSSSIDKKI